MMSVVTPVYNGEEFILDAMKSVRSQAYPLEHIVVDDGSTDSTPEIVKAFSGVDYVHQEHAGAATALNRGLSLARGKYGAYLAADDLWLSGKAAREVQAFGDHTVGVYSDVWINEVDGRSNCMEDYDRQTLLRRDYINLSAFTFRMSTAKRMRRRDGYFFDPVMEPCADWDFLIRLSNLGPFVHLPHKLAIYRHHPDQLSRRQIPMFLGRMRVLGKHNPLPMRTAYGYLINNGAAMMGLGRYIIK